MINTTSEKIGTIFYINGKYLQLMLCPYQLTFSYFYNDIPFVKWYDWRSVGSLVAYIGIGYYVVRKFKDKSLGVYGLLCYLAGLSIFSHVLIPFANAMGERLAFTMSWGFCIFLGSWWVSGIGLLTRWKRVLLGLGYGIVLVLYAYKVYSRVPDWKDNLSISLADEKASPNSFFINEGLFNYYYKKHLFEKDTMSLSKAMKYIDKLCTLDPQRSSFSVKKGHLHLLANQPTQAQEAFEKAISYQKQERNPFQTLELVEKYWDDAKVKAVVDYPSLGYVYKHIGELFFSVNNYQKALTYFTLSLSSMETAIGKFHAYKDVGITYFKLNEYKKSLEFLTKAYQLQPNEFNVNNALGHTNFYLGNYEKSIQHFEKAFEARPVEEVLNNIIIICNLIGDRNKLQHYTKIKESFKSQINQSGSNSQK
ncbi:MAG: hypothetical protein RMJ44_05510 [Cytophagales bacterium]|nr:hypothetical protein [Cytophagales bacterium]